MDENKTLHDEERELLHNQLKLLAEQSAKCQIEPLELAALSEQMVLIYSALNNHHSALSPVITAD